jgi:hypothetical protein
VHPTLPLVACASLDRHVRVYKLEGAGELVQKVYLKQRLAALLLSSDVPASAGDGDAEMNTEIDEMLGVRRRAALTFFARRGLLMVGQL